MNSTVISKIIDDIPVEICGEDITEEEIRMYINHGQAAHGKIDGLKIKTDGDYVDLEYKLPAAGFDRIRRITGYLVGTLDRFNNGKRAEVMDRVTHSCCN